MEPKTIGACWLKWIKPVAASAQPSIEIVDFYHACDHLKNGCDAAWGESTARGKAEFERLKTLLKEADAGCRAGDP